MLNSLSFVRKIIISILFEEIKMVSWSALGRSFGINYIKNHLKTPNTIKNVAFSTNTVLKAGHGHETMAMQPSR